MNVPKAIEIKEIFYNGGEVPNWEDYRLADKISIEALVRIRYQRLKPTVPHKTLLPSETED